jgi:DNA-directed RNA polymerase specialized sigma24 family protein
LKEKNRILRRNLTRRDAWPESTYWAAYYWAEKWVPGDVTLARQIAFDALALAYMKYGKRKLRTGSVSTQELQPLVQAAWHEIDSPGSDDDTVRLEESKRLNTLDLPTDPLEDVEGRIARLNPGVKDIARQLYGGATLAEIARGMNVTESALRVRLHRFRQRMRE